MDFLKIITLGLSRSRTPKERDAKIIYDLTIRFKTAFDELLKLDAQFQTEDFLRGIISYVGWMEDPFGRYLKTISEGGTVDIAQLKLEIDHFLDEWRPGIVKRIESYVQMFTEDFGEVQHGRKPKKFDVSKDSIGKFNQIVEKEKALIGMLNSIAERLKPFEFNYFS